VQPLPLRALTGGAALALTAVAFAPACAGKVACADLGSDWTNCPSPHADICVRKGSEGQCSAISGSGSSSSSSSSSSSGGTACPSPDLTKCATGCTDLTIDSSNCGVCGRKCNFPESCLNSVCQ
jgi:hypothetical protein